VAIEYECNLFLSALIIYSFVKGKYGSTAAIISMVVFYTIPALSWLSITAIADLTLTYYSLLSIIAAIRLMSGFDSSWVWLAGISLGATLGNKFSALLGFLLISIYLFLYVIFEKRNLRDRITKLVFMGVFAIIIASPWYIRSFIHTGNPVFPFGYSIFGGAYWSEELAEKMVAGVGNSVKDGTFLISEIELLIRLLKPEHMPYGGPISWIFVAIIIWGAFHFRERPISLLLFYFAGFYFFWARFTWQQVRYILPALGGLCILIGHAVHSIINSGYQVKIDLFKSEEKPVATRTLRLSIVLVGFLLIGIMAEGIFEYWQTREYSFKEQIFVVLGRMSRRTYLEKYLNISSMFFYINEELPQGSTVLGFNEVRGYLVDVEYLWGVPGLQGYVNYPALTQDKALKMRFEGVGVDYILINNSQYPTDAMELEPVREDMTLVKQLGEIYLYEFDSTSD
jgi:4-amino-4-deoxy-L-arabinose transferase-like glycosyltransferase